ncbi:ERF family protein [Undibacterium sp.]|uniref:ERF family protein n=1 Tax=Undibacterium sp. TaxID=1914977 RepID=UPI003750EA5F
MKEIAAAFVRAQKQFSPALKTSTNPHFKSKYVSLDGCIEAVIDALNNNGIALIQKNIRDDSGVTVSTVFLHESGEQIDGGELHVPASKQDPQGYGSALTYARRYSLMAACGIAPEDDDGNGAMKNNAANATTAKQNYMAFEFAASVKSGKTKEAAHRLSLLGEKELDEVWTKLDQKTQEALTAAWPK